MSYIEPVAPLPTTTRVTISLWFRVPHTTIAAAKAAFAAYVAALDIDSSTPRPPLIGVIPLMVWGKAQQAKGIDVTQVADGTITVNFEHWTDGAADCAGAGWEIDNTTTQDQSVSNYINNDDRFSIDPSYIGIDVAGAYPQLSVNLVMPDGNTATYSGSSWANSDGTGSRTVVSAGGGGICPGAPSAGPGCFGYTSSGITTVLNDISYSEHLSGAGDIVFGCRPETFRLLPISRPGDHIGGADYADGNFKGIRVSADHWHHVVVSVDLSECSAKGGTWTRDSFRVNPYVAGSYSEEITAGEVVAASKIYVAFDDVNYTGSKLSCYQAGANPNNVLPASGYAIYRDKAQVVTSTITYDCLGNGGTTVTTSDQGNYSVTPQGVAFGGAAIGLPATGTHSDAIYKVEMAELQVFTGRTIDTSAEDNRRAFVTAKGKPAPLKKARDLMGKEPELLLHGAKNWQKGINTGTLNNEINNELDEGTHVGVIDKYTPNPSLYGKDQGKPN